MAYRTHMQQISAGNQFNGTAPTGAGSAGNGKITYPEEAAGGLFEIAPVDPGHVMGIQLYGLAGGGTQTWKIEKVTAEGDLYTLAEGTTQASYFMKASDRVLMLPGEKIKVTTTNMTGPMKCMVSTDYDLQGGSDG